MVLLDVGLPGRIGVVLAGKLRKKFPHALVLMVIAANDDGVALAAILAGTGSYALKRRDMVRIIEAVAVELASGASMTPSIARKALSLMQRQAVPSPEASASVEIPILTTRERSPLLHPHNPASVYWIPTTEKSKSIICFIRFKMLPLSKHKVTDFTRHRLNGAIFRALRESIRTSTILSA